MDGRSELFAYLGTSIATIAVLFGLQYWYASYIDVFVVHADRSDVPQSATVVLARKQESEKLKALDNAKEQFAKRGRSAFSSLTPKPSDDLTPMSGWIYRPGFKPYEPRAPQAPAQEPTVEGGVVVPATGAEGAPQQGASVTPPTAPVAPAAASPAAGHKAALEGIRRALALKRAQEPKAAPAPRDLQGTPQPAGTP